MATWRNEFRASVEAGVPMFKRRTLACEVFILSKMDYISPTKTKS